MVPVVVVVVDVDVDVVDVGVVAVDAVDVDEADVDVVVVVVVAVGAAGNGTLSTVPTPMMPHAIRAPLFPVVFDSVLLPSPRSSCPACTCSPHISHCQTYMYVYAHIPQARAQ